MYCNNYDVWSSYYLNWRLIDSTLHWTRLRSKKHFTLSAASSLHAVTISVWRNLKHSHVISVFLIIQSVSQTSQIEGHAQSWQCDPTMLSSHYSASHHHIHCSMSLDPTEDNTDLGDHLVNSLPLARVRWYNQTWSPSWNPAELGRWS
jgi:hypothetical protein